MITDKMQKYLMYIVSEVQSENLSLVQESKQEKREAFNILNLFMLSIQEKIKARHIRLAALESTHLSMIKYVQFLSRRYDSVIALDDYSVASDIIETWKSYQQKECALCEVEARFVF